MALWGLGLALPLLAHGQSAPPAPGDTATTTAPTALWASADAVTLRAALPSGARLIVDAVKGQRLRVRSDSGPGWVSRSALDPRPAVVRRSAPGRSAVTGVRPSWRLPLAGRRPFPVFGRRRAAIAIPRLARFTGRGGATIVSVFLSNPSRRTVKSVRLGLVLYDRAADSTMQNVRRRTARALGPLNPQSLAAYTFRMPKGTSRACVMVRRATVDYLDGTTVRVPLSRTDGRSAEGRARGGPLNAGDACRADRQLRESRESP